MGTKFASGKQAIAECDRCGFRYKLKQLRKLTIKTKNVNILVCPTCWEQDHPQLSLGLYPVNDPQALRNPRPDTSYDQSGDNNGGSRQIAWGWNPVGDANPLGLSGVTASLEATASLGTVTISIT